MYLITKNKVLFSLTCSENNTKRKTWTNWRRKARGCLDKAWARAATGTIRKDGKETLYEDKMDGLEFLDVEEDREGWSGWPVCQIG